MIRKDTEESICREYLRNERIRDIASEYNVSQATIMVILRRNDIPLRGGKRITSDTEESVVALYQAGKSIIDIIRLTGVRSKQTVYRILKDQNVKMRRNRRLTD